MQYMKNQGILKYAFFRPNNKLDRNEMLATSLKNNSLNIAKHCLCEDLSGLQVTATNCIVQATKLREKFQQTNASKQKQGKEKERAYKCARVYGSRKSSQPLQDFIPCLCTDMVPCIEHYCRISNVP